MRTLVRVVAGDPTRVPADAIIAFIDASRFVFGRIFIELGKVGGKTFVEQVQEHGFRRNGELIPTTSRGSYGGGFNRVVFVVDNHTTPLNQLVLPALHELDSAGTGRIAINLPPDRLLEDGTHQSTEALLDEFTNMMDTFVAAPPKHVFEVTIVVNLVSNPDEIVDTLREHFDVINGS